ncbi:hypothetical protein [Tunturibacter empetritectus]|uniref:Uncharacterized protein n=1 Tax=Tunturiibacter lichenicola TaxID=2051959 RepID=A0A7W8N5R5_9BACT|nr:hypothetical protein [Edaphobacter lichenicola]MBB5345858.1 hypothetical protein [Edaphobacter lichenicola]
MPEREADALGVGSGGASGAEKRRRGGGNRGSVGRSSGPADDPDATVPEPKPEPFRPTPRSSALLWFDLRRRFREYSKAWPSRRPVWTWTAFFLSLLFFAGLLTLEYEQSRFSWSRSLSSDNRLG